MDGVEHALIQQNRLYRNAAGGITVFHLDGARSGPDIMIRENTIDFDPGVGRYGIQVHNGSTGVSVFRNAVTCGRGPALEVDTASIPGLTSDQNILKTTSRPEPVRLNDENWLTLQAWQTQSKQDTHSLSEGEGDRGAR